MFAEFGFGVLVIALCVSIFALTTALLGYFLSNEKFVIWALRAQRLTFPLLTLAVMSLVFLLVNENFEVTYVYSVTDVSMPIYLKITSLWGGQSGSLLFWTWLLTGFSAAMTLRNWERDQDFLPWVIVVTMLTMVFFAAVLIIFENPYTRWWLTPDGDYVSQMFSPMGGTLVHPVNGQGLNPLLRHPGMILHPPMLYLGFVGFIIPYAYAIAALITGKTDNRWIRITRKWTLLAWLFLSFGLVLGMRWAYDVLGWGGYWGWDPVEISALLPWLSGTAFLHSIIIEEKRGTMKHWNLLLITLTFSLVIFGTFLTRSGILSSVHAFASSPIGPAFFIFIGLTFIISTGLLLSRWNVFRSAQSMSSVLSREGLFIINNFLFVGVLIVCLWGVLFPLFSEVITGENITVGPPFYENAAGPLLGVLLGLMAIAPLFAWGHTTLKVLGHSIWKPTLLSLIFIVGAYIAGADNWIALVGFFLISLVFLVIVFEFQRGILARMRTRSEKFLVAIIHIISHNRRRYGGYIIHLSMALMAIGIIGIELFQTTTQKNLSAGESIELSGYSIRFDSIEQFYLTDGRYVTQAAMIIMRDGKFLQEIYPRYEIYPDGQSITIAGVRSTLINDIYVVLANWEDVSGEQTPFKVYYNPLINWLWIGAAVIIIGYMITTWPEGSKLSGNEAG